MISWLVISYLAVHGPLPNSPNHRDTYLAVTKVMMIVMRKFSEDTFPETNIVSENRPWERRFLLEITSFRGKQLVSGRVIPETQLRAFGGFRC